MSCSAKDFVLHLLDKNPRKRYKAPQIRIHPWILEDNYENGHLESRIENLKQYKVSRNMEKVKFLIEKTLLEIN